MWRNRNRLSRDTVDPFILDKPQKWGTRPSQRYHRYCNPTNWHRNIRDNFARLPHPHHPAQKCWNQTQSSGPHLPALTRNRAIPWHHIRLAYFCNNFTSLTLSLTYDQHTTAPFFPAVLQQLLSGIPFLHDSTCTSQHPSLYKKCHHIGFWHWNWRCFWVLIQIHRFTYLRSTLLYM